MVEGSGRDGEGQSSSEQLQIRAARWEIISGIFTVVALIVGVITLFLGFYQFQQTNQLEEEAAATEVLQNYLATNAEHPGIEDRPYIGAGESELNAEYGWVASNAMSTAETIQVALGDDPGWELTAASIVKDYDEFVLDPRWREASEDAWFECDYYSQDFVSFMEAQLDENICP